MLYRRSLIPLISNVSYIVDDYSPKVALSLRKLSSTATNCIRVRRSSDNSEQDIGFSGNYLDESALTTFVGANDGFIVKYYNQSSDGATYDAVETTTANQPRIVNSGTLETKNGITAINGNVASSTQMSLLNGFSMASGGTYFGVWSVNGATSVATFLMPFTVLSNASYFFGAASNGDSNVTYANFGTPTHYNNGTLISPTNRDQMYDQMADGGLKLLRTENLAHSTGFAHVLQYPTSALDADCYFNEIIIFDNNVSAENIAGIETNINSHYSIT